MNCGHSHAAKPRACSKKSCEARLIDDLSREWTFSMRQDCRPGCTILPRTFCEILAYVLSPSARANLVLYSQGDGHAKARDCRCHSFMCGTYAAEHLNG